MPIEIIECPIEKVTPYERNPRINDAGVDAVADSIREYGFRQPLVLDENYVIIIGHTRWRAAKKLGLTSVPVHIADLPADKARALRIADNQTASLSSWDMDLLPLEIAALQDMNYDLSHLGFDNDALSKMLQSANGEPDADAEVTPTELETIQPEALKLIEESDRVVLQFSGGKDSTVALNWVRGVCEKFKKPLTALFVETGSELPCVLSHVIRVCEKVGVELVLLHPKENILHYYFKKKMWPDSLFRDCLHKFINEPVNHYLRQFENENVICVRGGRNDQKTSLSKSDTYQEVKDGDRIVKLLNPLFAVSKEDYEKALEEVKPLLWRGYELGFLRTACYMCPFQRVDQWESLKLHYPLLWEEMRLLSQRLEYKEYKGDSTRTRFLDYWQTQLPLH